jgi:hypothetical protein
MTRALLVIGGAAAAVAYVSVELVTRWANLDARLDHLERLDRYVEHRLEVLERFARAELGVGEAPGCWRRPAEEERLREDLREQMERPLR